MKEEDNNLENFFKKRLDSNQFEYQEADWKLLETRLDAAGIGTQGASSTTNTLKIISGAIVFTSLSFLAGWLIRDQKEDASKVSNNTTQNIESLASINPPILTEETTGGLIPDDSKEECDEEPIAATIPSAKDEKLPKEDLNEIVKINKNARSASNETRSASLQVTKTENEMATSNTLILNTTQSNSDLESADEDVTNSGNTGHADTKVEAYVQPIDVAIELNQEPKDGIMAEKSTLIEFNKIPLLLQDSTEVAAEAIQVILTNKTGRFSVGLALSPDFNGVALGEKMSASLRPGIVIFYRILPKISVSTGAHFDQKRYESTAENYSTPAGYWGYKTNGYIPSLIHGSCRVIDIPLNVNVRFTDFPRINFGGSAGVSSYILLDEAYRYEFEQDNPGADTGWATKENSNYIAGLVNLSFYLSTAIGRNTELFLEPYFKTPIKDVGWAKVSLYGSGVQFTVKYNFTSFQKQNN